jgi:dTMP kinase
MSLFITFEGPEGSGKSTQAQRLYEQLDELNYPVIKTREPGGTTISERIRGIILDMRHSEMAPTTEMLLFTAARAQLVAEKIQPALDYGGIVVCDRFADSFLAYQGYGFGRDLDDLRTLTRIATNGVRPDITFYLDLPAQEGLDRKQLKATQRSATSSPLSPRAANPMPQQEWNRLDARSLEYHERVRQGFLQLVKQEPERWQVLDGHLSVKELSAHIWQTVEPRLLTIRRLQEERQ